MLRWVGNIITITTFHNKEKIQIYVFQFQSF